MPGLVGGGDATPADAKLQVADVEARQLPPQKDEGCCFFFAATLFTDLLSMELFVLLY